MHSRYYGALLAVLFKPKAGMTLPVGVIPATCSGAHVKQVPRSVHSVVARNLGTRHSR